MKFWEWFQRRVLGRTDIWFNGSLYMRRWLFGPKWFWGLRVHCIERSDADRELHDHPFNFVSLIVSGGYWEWLPCDGLWMGHDEVPCGGEHKVWHEPGSIIRRRAEDLHRIELSDSHGLVKAWTIVLRGPYRRNWGFMTEAGWKHWWVFTRERDGKGSAAGKYAAPSSL